MNENKPITPDELDAMEARADAATRGPWDYFSKFVTVILGGDFDVILSEMHTQFDKYEENGVFIAAARSDVPRLVAEVRRLHEENAALLKSVAEYQRNLIETDQGTA